MFRNSWMKKKRVSTLLVKAVKQDLTQVKEIFLSSETINELKSYEKLLFILADEPSLLERLGLVVEKDNIYFPAYASQENRIALGRLNFFKCNPFVGDIGKRDKRLLFTLPLRTFSRVNYIEKIVSFFEHQDKHLLQIEKIDTLNGEMDVLVEELCEREDCLNPSFMCGIQKEHRFCIDHCNQCERREDCKVLYEETSLLCESMLQAGGQTEVTTRDLESLSQQFHQLIKKKDDQMMNSAVKIVFLWPFRKCSTDFLFLKGYQEEDLRLRKNFMSIGLFTQAISFLRILALLLYNQDLEVRIENPKLRKLLLKMVEDILCFGLVLATPRGDDTRQLVVSRVHKRWGDQFAYEYFCALHLRFRDEPFLLYNLGKSFRSYYGDRYIDESSVRCRYFDWWPRWIASDPIGADVGRRESEAQGYINTIFTNWGGSIKNKLKRNKEIIYADLGCGDGILSRRFVRSLKSLLPNKPVTCYLVEASDDVYKAKDELLKEGSNVTVIERKGDALRLAEISSLPQQCDVILLSQLLDLYTDTNIEPVPPQTLGLEGVTLSPKELLIKTYESYIDRCERFSGKWRELKNLASLLTIGETKDYRSVGDAILRIEKPGVRRKTVKLAKRCLSPYYFLIKALVERKKGEDAKLVYKDESIFYRQTRPKSEFNIQLVLTNLLEKSKILILIDRYYDKEFIKSKMRRITIKHCETIGREPLARQTIVVR